MSPEQEPPSPATPASGSDDRLAGRYDLLEAIGRGGMSEVYRARDSAGGRYVAVKMLAADLEVTEETRERFLREARAAGQIAHRNIITIFDSGEDRGRLYIVMELLEGESLTRLMAREPRMPIERRIDLMMRICEGLSYAHSFGIVHRDVKPGNLFVTSDGQLKILDFGVARIAESTLTVAGVLVGTPDYMSPEQVEGRVVDQRSDVFSAGAVFYQLLSGRKPFESPKLPDLLRKVATEPPTRLTDEEAPPELAAIVMRALEKDPRRRYQRMQDMLAALARLQQAFDHQTRTLATRACDRYHEIERMLADGQQLAADLGVPIEPEDVSVAPLLRDLPLFHDHGADVLRLVPFQRARISEITRLLQRQYEALATRNASWRNAITVAAAAESQMKGGAFQEALAALEPVAASVPGSPRVRGLIERCRFEARQARPASDPAPTVRQTAPVQDKPVEPASGPTGRRPPGSLTTVIDRLYVDRPRGPDLDLDLRRHSATPAPPASGLSRTLAPALAWQWASHKRGLAVAAIALALIAALILWLTARGSASPDGSTAPSGAMPGQSMAADPSPPLVASGALTASPEIEQPLVLAAAEPEDDARGSKEVPVDPPAQRAGAAAPTPGARPETPERNEFIAAGKRSNETVEAWRARSAALTDRYGRGKEALAAREFSRAIGIFEALEREEPGFADTPALLRAAREQRRRSARALVEEGTRQQARGDFAAARASFEDAERIDPEYSAPPTALAQLRQAMHAEGRQALRRAEAEEAAERPAAAAALYRRAMALLPADDPGRAVAERKLLELQDGRR